MYSISSQNGKESYGIYSFICDTIEDLKNLPQCAMGSSALVLASSDVYIKNGSNEWQLI